MEKRSNRTNSKDCVSDISIVLVVGLRAERDCRRSDGPDTRPTIHFVSPSLPSLEIHFAAQRLRLVVPREVSKFVSVFGFSLFGFWRDRRWERRQDTSPLPVKKAFRRNRGRRQSRTYG